MKLFYTKLKAFLIHLLISALVIGSLFVLIYFVWYPEPFQVLEGVEQVTIIILLVDLVLGPILTFALYKPGKKGLMMDLSLIALIQIGALVYGAEIIYSERPMYVSFSYDQFKTVQAKDVDLSQIQSDEIKSHFFRAPIYVNVKMPGDSEKLKQILSGVQSKGKNIFAMSQLYQPFAAHFQSATKHASFINPDKLSKNHPEKNAELQQFRDKAKISNSDIRLLPVQGSKKDMILLFNKNNGSVIGHILLSPWALLKK